MGGTAVPPFNLYLMKHLINLFTTIGMVVMFLAFIALACYIHDAL